MRGRQWPRKLPALKVRSRPFTPTVPELPSPCSPAPARAIHSIIFGGFSATAISDRVHDAIAPDHPPTRLRRGGTSPHDAVDEALANRPTVKSVLVKRTNNTCNVAGRDHWRHEVMAEVSSDCPAEMDAEDPLYILYTSAPPASLGHPAQHCGYMVGTYLTSKYVFDLKEEVPVHRRHRLGQWPQHIVYGILG